MGSSLKMYGNTYNGVEGIKATDLNDVTRVFVLTEDATSNSNNQLLSGVTAFGASGKYTGTIPIKTSTDVIVSGATTTVPAGYYASQISKSVSTATHPDPTVGINTANGLITASHAQTTGYVTAGTTNKTLQLTTLAATTIAPTESEQTAVAANIYTTGIIKVGAIASNYVGSGITTRTASSLTASGATVTVPAGYYASQVTKSVASGSATTPASTITVAPSISVNSSGLITASCSTSKSITPTISTGYVSAGTAGTITVSGSNTSQLTTLGATTYNVSSSNQTISSGRYLTGNQTIRGVTVSGLTATNIASGITIKVGDSADDDRITSVTGTFTSDANATATDIVSGKSGYVNGTKINGSLVVNNYYTGTNTPSSSLGSNGDLYFQTSE